MYIKKTHNFPLISLWNVNFKCVKWCKNLWIHHCLVFKIFKLSTKDIIVVLKDTMNTTSSPLPIPDPHATGVPSNTSKRHVIGSCGIHNLVISYSMATLVGFFTSNFTFTYQKGTKNTSFVDLLLNKGVVDNHFLHKVSHSSPKVMSSERTSIAIGVAIVDNIELAIQVGGHIVTKKRGFENTQHLNCLQRTHASMLSQSTSHIQTSNLYDTRTAY
jgi:hypothetical protein